MNEIKKIDSTTDLAILHPGTYRAIDVRNQMLRVPEVIQTLTPIEKRMFEASIKTPVAEFSDIELTNKVGLIAKYIAIDTGIKSIDDYELTRFMTILKTYYSLFSLQEISIAFELAMTGELDEFLPKDRDGNPDKNHYQSFNVEYITKILNAYKKRKRDTEHKAYTALPKNSKELTTAEMQLYNSWGKRMLIEAFLRYKYLGEINIESLNEYILYRELEIIGLEEPVIITDADRTKAVTRLLQKSQKGLINSFVADCIRRLRTKHSDVTGEAFLIAKKRAVVQSLDYIITNEIQLIDLLI